MCDGENLYYASYEQRYQAVYAAGADLWGYAPDDQKLIDVLSRWVNENKLTGKRIIEFACGEGGAGKIIAGLGCDYHGVDLAPSAIATAKRMLADCPNATVSRLDMVKDRVSGRYDGALDVMGFHILLTDQDRAAYLKNVYNCLNPGAPMLFYREAYSRQAYEGPVGSYDEWIEIVGGGYDYPVKKYAKKGKEKVEVMIPRMPGRIKSEAGYRREFAEAGLVVDHFEEELGKDEVAYFASIWVHKASQP